MITKSTDHGFILYLHLSMKSIIDISLYFCMPIILKHVVD